MRNKNETVKSILKKSWLFIDAYSNYSYCYFWINRNNKYYMKTKDELDQFANELAKVGCGIMALCILIPLIIILLCAIV